MTERRQKIVTVLFGAVAAFLLLEAGLRIAGGVYRARKESSRERPVARDDEQYVVLCVGKSFTAGHGISAWKAYPGQLQRLFDARIAGRPVTVVNGGVDNANSAELLSGLESAIDEVRPDLIVLRTGGPNLWNHHQYSDYLRREGIYRSFPERALLSLHDFCYNNSRVYRLIPLASRIVRDRFRSQLQKPRLRDAKKEVKLWLRAQSIRLGVLRPGESYLRKKGYESAIAWLEDETKRWRRTASGEPFSVDEKKAKEAIRWFEKAAEKEPRCLQHYEHLVWAHFLRGDHDTSMQWFRTFTARHHLSRGVDTDEVDRWRESDIREIVRIIRERGVALILQNYPPFPGNRERLVNRILRTIARDEAIPFVDNERLFMKMIEDGQRYADLFQTNDVHGHCNHRGYRVMAEHVYAAIVEEGMPGREQWMRHD
jgi:lysophospholipase L1-like esterase